MGKSYIFRFLYLLIHALTSAAMQLNHRGFGSWWVITYDSFTWMQSLIHGPPARYVKLRIAHAPEMPGTFFPPPRVSDPDMHHGTCVTHVPWCMPELLTSGFFQSQWRGKRSLNSGRMRNPKFYVSGKKTKAQRRWLIQYLLTGGAFHVELSKCFLGRNMSRQISPAYRWKNILIEMYHCKFIFVRKFTWW